MYFIGVGGTGARVAEAVIHAASSGLIEDTEIAFLFVDADENNGNLQRTRFSLACYKNCRDKVRRDNDPNLLWLSPAISDLGVASPVNAKEVTLGEYFQYATMQASSKNAADMFDLLFTSKEKNMPLSEGFRGHPSVGAAFFRDRIIFPDAPKGGKDIANGTEETINKEVNINGRAKDSQDAWSNFIRDIQVRLKGGDNAAPFKIILCGSIFGGTGASGLPSIAREIHRYLINTEIGGNRNGRDLGKIQSVLMLPYFRFDEADLDDSEKKKLFANSDDFMLNTEAALRYYEKEMKDSDGQNILDAVYVAGSQTQLPVQAYVGRSEQNNPPHFAELFASISIADFLSRSKDQSADKSFYTYVMEHQKQITWADLPSSCKPLYSSALRFAFVWLADTYSELLEGNKIGTKKFLAAAPWARPFFSRDGRDKPLLDESQILLAKQIAQWSADILRWWSAIHFFNAQGEKININDRLPKVMLFDDRCFSESICGLIGYLNIGAINDLPTTESTHLQSLIIGDKRGNEILRNDTIKLIKDKLDRQEFRDYLSNPDKLTGIAGLAKAVYITCKV
jgi:hypothetical protein